MLMYNNLWLSDTLRTKDKKKKKKAQKKEEEEEEEDEAEKITYSQEITRYDKGLSFQDMNLSRPLLKVCDWLIAK